ncbi:hypothetical protein D3C78_789310 [compost metagenome]
MVEQLVEVTRGGGRRFSLQRQEALHSRVAVTLSQFDLPQQQVGNVGEAAETEVVELLQSLCHVEACLAKQAKVEQASGSVEAQHRAGGVALRISLQRPARQFQAMAQVAAEEREKGTQVGDGLLDPLGVARHILALKAPDACLRAGDVVGRQHDGGFADGQGEVIAAVLPGNLAEQVDQRVDLPIAQQVEGVAFGDGEHRVEVPGPAVLMDGLRVAALLQQPGGSLLVQLLQQLRIALLQALVEHAAEDRMVAVFHALAGALLDEQVAAQQLTNQPFGIRLAAQDARQRRVEGLHHRGALEEGQQLGRELSEQLFFEEARHIGVGLPGHVAQVPARLAGRRLLAVGSEPEQQAADPAFAAGAQLVVEGIVAQLCAAAVGQLASFLAVQGQLAGIKDGQPLLATQVAEGQFRLAFAGGQQVQAGRPEAQQLLEVVAGTAGAQQVQVVEDQGEVVRRVLQSLEDGAPQARLVGRHQVVFGRGQAKGGMQVQQ